VVVTPALGAGRGAVNHENNEALANVDDFAPEPSAPTNLSRFHVQTLTIYKLGLNQNNCTFTQNICTILLIKIGSV
jgi:hypothetical protein